MASIIPDLTTYLLGRAAISSIVGTKIKSGSIAQGTEPPYIIIKVVAADHDQELSGRANFVKKTLSINCVAYSYAVADNLHEQVRLNLDSFQQQLMGSFWINSTRLTNEFDDEFEPASNNQKWTFTRTGIYDISYPQEEALP